ncbi:MAG TPA: thermonuclease family protein, partial [Streptosporangiaceae bacterium]
MIVPKRFAAAWSAVALMMPGCLAVPGCAAAGDAARPGRTIPVPPAPAPSPWSPRFVPARVAYVIDGDTLVVTARGRRLRVRLLGLDAPEDTRRRGCYGRQATAALRRLLPAGAAVLLAVDRRRADPDGRALGYVWRADGAFVNRVLLRRGLATTLFLPPAGDPYRGRLAAAQAAARAARAGLWLACRSRFPTRGQARTKTRSI